MPRKQLIRTSEFPYHVTTRTNNKDWFQLPLEEVWDICKEAFDSVTDKTDVEVHAFVLMGNHYHMLLTTPHANIDFVMMVFNKYISEAIKKRTDRMNRMFGGRYHWSIIKDQRYLYNVIRYIFQNPIRANICERVEEYPYSTFTQHYLNEKTIVPIAKIMDIPILELHQFFNNNQFKNKDENELITRGLRKGYFSVKIDSNSGRPFLLS